MRKLSIVLSSVVLAGSALAAEPNPPAASSADPMAAWRPPKVAHEAKDRQEILALFAKMEQAGRKADLDAAAALVDFPVLMVTDDSRGEAYGEPWSREQWMEAMRPFYEKPMDMRVQHRPTISVLTDSLATVVDHATFTLGGRTVTTRTSSLLVRKGGDLDDPGAAGGCVRAGRGHGTVVGGRRRRRRRRRGGDVHVERSVSRRRAWATGRAPATAASGRRPRGPSGGRRRRTARP